MAASLTDLITDSFNSGNPNVAKVTAGRTAGAATLTCDNLAGWPTVSKVHLSTYKIDTSANVVAGSQIDWEGIVSGNSIGSLTRMAGATDAGNTIGDIVEMNVTGAWGHDLYSWGTAQHNKDGTHSAVTATSVTATAAVQGATVISTGDVQRRSVSTEAIDSEHFFDYIASGCVLSGTGYGSTLAWNLTSGVVYIGGKRLTVASTTGTVTASKDTYFDLLDPGSGTVATLVNTSGNIVANNAASPALAASSVRLGIIVSAVNIAAATSVNQGQETMLLPIASSIPYSVTDSLGNLICPRDPNHRVLGYQQILTDFTTAATPTVTDVTGIAVPFIAPGNRKVKATLWSPSLYSTAAIGTNMTAYIREGSTTLQATGFNAGASQYASQVVPVYLATPTAGLHTYKASISQNAAGTMHFTAGSATPAYLLIELE